MTSHKQDFLLLMRAALGNTENENKACGEIDWKNVFLLAEQHHVLPMIVDVAYRIFGNDIPIEYLVPYKKRAQRITYLQTVKTERFLSLYKLLSEKGLHPLVMKGIICRELYPKPDFRFSADEDFLIPPDEAAKYHETLSALGLKTDSTIQEAVSEQETPYKSADGVLFLEVHRYAFPPDSAAYGEYNKNFENVFERAIKSQCTGTEVWTMEPTDNLFYMICHALKHFMHGGFGIRQVCDIGLFAEKYSAQIDWGRISEQIRSIRGEMLTAALFAIAEKSLGIDLGDVQQKFCYEAGDSDALLEDILDSGVYGSATLSRKHSATMTLHAAEKAGSKNKHSLIRSLFPPASTLKKSYPYLTKKPGMLPAAWIQRIFHYIRERDNANTPVKAFRIGRERVSLMKKYGLTADPIEKPVKIVDTGKYLSALCELIAQGHEVSIPVTGSSMTPFLGDGRDQVFVSTLRRTPRKGDIALFQRDDGTYVLHRIYRVHGTGDNVTCDLIGDAQDTIEHNIRENQINGIVTRACRKGEMIEPGNLYWWFFQHVWIRMIPLRRPLMRLYAVIYK